MIRRGLRTGEVPAGLLAYRADDWSSPEAWHSARAAWREVHPPKSLDDLNAFYSGPFAPRPDPREVLDAA